MRPTVPDVLDLGGRWGLGGGKGWDYPILRVDGVSTRFGCGEVELPWLDGWIDPVSYP